MSRPSDAPTLISNAYCANYFRLLPSIYTAGTRYYARKVAHAICRYCVGAPDVDKFTLENASDLEKSAIELRKSLFGNRIVSRSETGDMHVKNLARVFPDGGQMSVILDDREDVWANANDDNELVG